METLKPPPLLRPKAFKLAAQSMSEKYKWKKKRIYD